MRSDDSRASLAYSFENTLRALLCPLLRGTSCPFTKILSDKMGTSVGSAETCKCGWWWNKLGYDWDEYKMLSIILETCQFVNNKTPHQKKKCFTSDQNRLVSWLRRQDSAAGCVFLPLVPSSPGKNRIKLLADRLASQLSPTWLSCSLSFEDDQLPWESPLVPVRVSAHFLKDETLPLPPPFLLLLEKTTKSASILEESLQAFK